MAVERAAMALERRSGGTGRAAAGAGAAAAAEAAAAAAVDSERGWERGKNKIDDYSQERFARLKILQEQIQAQLKVIL